MPTSFSTNYKNSYLDGLTGRASFTTNVSQYISMYFYSGSQPASADSTATGTLLGTYNIGNPGTSFSAAASGVVEFISATSYVSAGSTTAGTVGYVRMTYNAGSPVHFDMPASLSGGGGSIILSTLTIAGGNTVLPAIVDMNFSIPASNGGTIRMNEALRNALATMMYSGTNAALFSSGTMTFYDGTQPAVGGGGLSGNNVIGTKSLGAAPYSAPASGSTTLNANIQVTASANGTPTWARISNGTKVMDVSVGTSGTDAILDTGTWTSGNTYNVTSLTLVFP